MDILDNASIKGLFSHLMEEFRMLVSKEIDLAKAEMTEKTSTAVKNAVTVSIGGAVAWAGFLVLLAALVYGLASFMPIWLSALIVGVIVTGGGAIAAMTAIKNLKRIKVEPERTVATLKDDKNWIKSEVENLTR